MSPRSIVSGSLGISQPGSSLAGAAITSFTPGPPVLVSIAVTPANPTINTGATQQFAATGTYSDGTTPDVTVASTWASSAPAVATVSNVPPNKGLAQALTVGSTLVSATIGAVSGHTTLTTLSAFTPLTVPGCLVWLDPNQSVGLTGGNVATWQNQSASGLLVGAAVTQAQALKQPGYGQGTGPHGNSKLIWTSNSAQILTAILSGTLTTPFTYYIVLSSDNTGTNNYALDFGGNTNAAQSGGSAWSVGVNNVGISLGAASPNVFHIVRFSSSTSSSFGTIDGGSQIPSTTPGASVTTMQVGSYGGDLGAFAWNGAMGDIALFDHVVTSPEDVALQAFFAARWQ